MAWYSKTKKLDGLREGAVVRLDGAPPWRKCDGCGEVVVTADWERNWNVCTLCGHHDPLPFRRRIELVSDPDSFQELDAELASADPLSFSDSKRYSERLKGTVKKTGMREAFVAGVSAIGGAPVSIGCFAFEFMGGSMGSVVGEKVARVFDRATDRGIPAVVFSSSGGARMQEGIFSLMQMAKTAAALNRFREVRKPYVSVMLHPTTGGVAASFSWLGDVILAEPKALIGFAGPRVIEQTIREKLPPGFQRAEFLLEHGMIDAVVKRHELRARLAQLLTLLA